MTNQRMSISQGTKPIKYSLDIKSIPEFEPKKTGLNLLIEEISKQMNARG